MRTISFVCGEKQHFLNTSLQFGSEKSFSPEIYVKNLISHRALKISIKCFSIRKVNNSHKYLYYIDVKITSKGKNLFMYPLEKL